MSQIDVLLPTLLIAFGAFGALYFRHTGKQIDAEREAGSGPAE